MAANRQPIFTLKPNTATTSGGTVFPANMLTATGDYTGVSANHVLVHTAGVDGSFIEKIGFKALGTNVASLVRIYINNGSTNATATNNVLVGEVYLPATTSSTSNPTPDMFYPLNMKVDPNFRIYAGVATTVAAGWMTLSYAGQYS